jgi:two-component system, cell cycle response regulator CtrA
MRILNVAVVDDLPDVDALLQPESFNVYSVDDAEEAVDLARLYDYDLIVLGDVAGAQKVLQTLRTAKVKTPVLRFSSLAYVPDIVAALNAGADDYMVRSELFQVQELIARIHAIVRRSKGHAQSLVTVGPMVVDLNQKAVSISGESVHLTGKEYAMLELMALRKGSLITKDMFLNHLYGGMDEPEIKIIDVFICKLRKKLGAWAYLVGTVWGRGYVLGGVEIASPSLAPEVRDMIDDPPTGRVHEGKTLNQFRKEHPELLKEPSPSIVPAAGQK